MRSRVCVFVSAFVLLFASSVFAEDLSGRVTDRSGGVLAGVTVRVTNVAGGGEVFVITDAGGRFQFSGLKAGTYRVSAALSGFSESARTVVLDGKTTSAAVEFMLELGTLKTEVTVAAARGARDTRVVPLRADAFGA